jgi:hypothetical protein
VELPPRPALPGQPPAIEAEPPPAAPAGFPLSPVMSAAPQPGPSQAPAASPPPASAPAPSPEQEREQAAADAVANTDGWIKKLGAAGEAAELEGFQQRGVPAADLNDLPSVGRAKNFPLMDSISEEGLTSGKVKMGGTFQAEVPESRLRTYTRDFRKMLKERWSQKAAEALLDPSNAARIQQLQQDGAWPAGLPTNATADQIAAFIRDHGTLSIPEDHVPQVQRYMRAAIAQFPENFGLPETPPPTDAQIDQLVDRVQSNGISSPAINRLVNPIAPNAFPSEAERNLATRQIQDVQPLQEPGVFRVTFTDGSQAMFTVGGAPAAVATSRTAEMLGFDLVPVTTPATLPDIGEGTLQEWVPTLEPARSPLDYPQLGAQQAAVIDYVTGQLARTDSTVRTEDGEPRLVGNGDSLPAGTDLPIRSPFVAEFDQGWRLPQNQQELDSRVVAHARSINVGDLVGMLRATGIDEEAANLAGQRLREIQDSGMIRLQAHPSLVDRHAPETPAPEERARPSGRPQPQGQQPGPARSPAPATPAPPGLAAANPVELLDKLAAILEWLIGAPSNIAETVVEETARGQGGYLRGRFWISTEAMGALTTAANAHAYGGTLDPEQVSEFLDAVLTMLHEGIHSVARPGAPEEAPEGVVDPFNRPAGKNLEEGLTESLAQAALADFAEVAGLLRMSGLTAQQLLAAQMIFNPYAAQRALVERFAENGGAALLGFSDPAEFLQAMARETSVSRPAAMIDAIIQAQGLPDTAAVRETLDEAIESGFEGETHKPIALSSDPQVGVDLADNALAVLTQAVAQIQAGQAPSTSPAPDEAPATPPDERQRPLGRPFPVNRRSSLIEVNPFDPEPPSSFGLAQLREQYLAESAAALRAEQGAAREALRQALQRWRTNRPNEAPQIRDQRAGAWNELRQRQEHDWVRRRGVATDEVVEATARYLNAISQPPEAQEVFAPGVFRLRDMGDGLDNRRDVTDTWFDVVVHPAGATTPPVTEIVLRITWLPGEDVTASDLADIELETRQSVDHTFNAPHHELPDGTVLRVTLQTAVAGDSRLYIPVRVHAGRGREYPTVWAVETDFASRARAVGHLLTLLLPHVNGRVELERPHLTQLASLIQLAREALPAEELTDGVIRYREDPTLDSSALVRATTEIEIEMAGAAAIVDRQLPATLEAMGEARRRVAQAARNLLVVMEQTPLTEPGVSRAQNRISELELVFERLDLLQREVLHTELDPALLRWNAWTQVLATGPDIPELADRVERAIEAVQKALSRRWHRTSRVAEPGAELDAATRALDTAVNEATEAVQAMYRIQDLLLRRLKESSRFGGPLEALDPELDGQIVEVLRNQDVWQREEAVRATEVTRITAGELLQKLGLRPSTPPPDERQRPKGIPAQAPAASARSGGEAAPEPEPEPFEKSPDVITNNPADPEPSSSHGLAEMRRFYEGVAAEALRTDQRAQRERMLFRHGRRLASARGKDLDRIRQRQAAELRALLDRQANDWLVWGGRLLDAVAEDAARLEAMRERPPEAGEVFAPAAQFGQTTLDAQGNPNGVTPLDSWFDVVVHPAGAKAPPITEIVLWISWQPDVGVTAADISRVEQESRLSVDHYFNAPRHRLPNGSQLRVSVRFTVGGDPRLHHAVWLHADGRRQNQVSWTVQSPFDARAHELGHFLGLHDEYFDPEHLAVGRETPTSAGVFRDGSLYGEHVGIPMGLKARHLRLLGAMIDQMRRALPPSELSQEDLVRYRRDPDRAGGQVRRSIVELERLIGISLNVLMGQVQITAIELWGGRTQLEQASRNLAVWLEGRDPADPEVQAGRQRLADAASLLPRLAALNDQVRRQELVQGIQLAVRQWGFWVQPLGNGQSPLDERAERIRAWAARVTRAIDAVSDAQEEGRPADQIAALTGDLEAATVALDAALQQAMAAVTTMREIQARLAAQLQGLAALGMDMSALDLGLRQAVTDVMGQGDRATRLDQLVDALDVVLTTAGGLLHELVKSPPAGPPGLRLDAMPTSTPDRPTQSNIGEMRADG